VDGQEHTAVQESNDAVILDGKSYILGAVTAVDGFRITLASGSIVAGATVYPTRKYQLRISRARRPLSKSTHTTLIASPGRYW
jgi:hypothetical protein